MIFMYTEALLFSEYPWVENRELRLLQQWLYLPEQYDYLGEKAFICKFLW